MHSSRRFTLKTAHNMALAVLFYVTFQATSALQCPEFSCGSLDSQVCAKRTSAYELSLNQDGCPLTRECRIMSLFTWLNSGDSSNLFYCQDPTTTTTTSPFQGEATCVARSQGKNFKGGLTVVLCETDAECVLEDNTVNAGSCVCGLRTDGQAICNPDVSSDAFEGYWQTCGNDNKITSVDAYNYWLYYIQMWVFLQSDVNCVQRLYEMQRMTTLYDLYSNSAPYLLFSILLI